MALVLFAIGLAVMWWGGRTMRLAGTIDRSIGGFFITYTGLILVLISLIFAVLGALA